ncbi:hypothetical protein CRENBAI_024769 [Crenichthys baileyi]|uniref:Uncharacterized protein n=1 Tax=Crenichthys baileyi TaxID=28760 RepID=A0AAV9SG69_9TELE
MQEDGDDSGGVECWRIDSQVSTDVGVQRSSQWLHGRVAREGVRRFLERINARLITKVGTKLESSAGTDHIVDGIRTKETGIWWNSISCSSTGKDCKRMGSLNQELRLEEQAHRRVFSSS